MRLTLLGLFMAFLATSNIALAQGRTVSGTITENGEGIPGVTIQVKGTTTGTVTSFDGTYSLIVPDNAVLVFSSVGFTTQEIAVGSRSIIDVSMAVDFTELDEVVVIGYGTVKKSDITGSVTSINSKDFNKGNINSPQDLMVGRVPGVSVITNGGAPGENATIRIRGGSSLTASNNPLFVIDDVVVSDEDVSGSRNPLSLINPNDIASINVLKDASATAIYGARASNGVIIITTKRGTAGQKPQFGYSGNFSIASIPETVDVLSGAEYREFISQNSGTGLELPAEAGDLLNLVGNASGDNITFDPNVSTDWQDLIFRDAFSMDHNISMSGGLTDLPAFLKSLPYRVSVGYADQEGILLNTNFQRFSSSFSLDPSLLNDDLRININGKYSSSVNTFTNEGAIGSAVVFDPTKPVFFNDNDLVNGYFYWPTTSDLTTPLTTAPNNPLALLEQTNNEATVNRFIGNLKATYKLPVDGLSATVNVGIDRTTTDGLEIVSEDASFERQIFQVDGEDLIVSGKRNTYTAEYKNELLEAYLNYSLDIPAIDASLTFVGGVSQQYFFRETFSGVFRLSADSVITAPDADQSENILKSQFGRLNFNISDKYYITGTLRRDGSSRFEGDNQWGIFPSVALGWQIASEDFMSNVGVVTDLKLRAGYGITGQENIIGSYPAEARVNISDDLAQYWFGSGPINTVRPEGFDANLKWEETTTYNIGLDFGIWNNRISGSFDLYSKETNDLLNQVSISAGTNFTNEITTNIGSMEINGFDAGLSAIVVDKNDWNVQLGANITRSSNEITDLTLVEDPDFIGVLTGGISGISNNIQIHSVGFQRSTFFMFEQVYDEGGNPIDGLFVDQDGDGIVNENDLVRSENPDPDYLMGFNGNFAYKNISLGFNARLSVGNYVYDNVSSQYHGFNNLYNSAGALNNTVSNFSDTNFEATQLFSDYYLHDASFFRMDNITLGYSFEEFLNENVSAAFSFTVQNAFVVTDYEGLDPELNNGIDNNIYPRPRTFVLGVNLNFR